MGTLFDASGPIEDVWLSIDGDQPTPSDQDIIVSLDYFLTHREALLGRNAGRFGVYLEAGEEISTIEDDLPHIAMLSLDFPSFADGRSFSKARWLRDRYTFGGELRAVGDVRIDQLAFFKRSGFSSWLVTHGPTIDGIIAGADPSLNQYYQPAFTDETATDTYTWRRQRS